MVSFRSQPWELYNMASDRTELHNLAEKHPKVVNRMSKLWYKMAEEVLEAPAKSRTPVATEATPHQHPEWTDFTKKLSQIGKREG